MKLRKSDFKGTAQVLKFTFLQLVKGKANLISLALLLLFSLASAPLMMLFAGDMVGQPAEFVTKIYLSNETELELDTEHSSYPIADADFDIADCGRKLGETEVFVRIYKEGEDTMYESVNKYGATDSFEDEFIEAAVSELFAMYNYTELGITQEQLDAAFMPTYSGVADYAVYKGEAEPEDEISFDAGEFAVQYIYAIIVMMTCLYSTIYIIRSIVEEKDSKIVELMMISVRPLAMILGKITAVMCYIVGMLLMLVCGFLTSFIVTGIATGAGALALLATLTAAIALPVAFPTLLPILILSLVLSYLQLSIIGGISGTCCSTMEDIQSANGSVTLLVIVGYTLSCFVPMIGNQAAIVVLSLLPVTSMFVAPAQYAVGGIGFGVLLISWVLQAGYALLLARFCSRVYGELIIRRGSRIKLGSLLRIAKEVK